MKLTKDDYEFLSRIGAWSHKGLRKKILANEKLGELIEEIVKRPRNSVREEEEYYLLQKLLDESKK